jgi:integrase
MNGIYYRADRQGKPWLVRLQVNGNKVSQCFGSEQEAIDFRDACEAQRLDLRPTHVLLGGSLVKTQHVRPGLKFRDAVQVWLTGRASELTGNSQASYAEIVFGRLVGWFGDYEVTKIDDRVVESFVRHCLTAPSARGTALTTKTVRNFLSPLSQFFVWAMRERMVAVNPVPVGSALLKSGRRKSEHDQQRKRLTKERFWTVDEAKKVLALAEKEPEFWMPIFFGLNTGGREGELGALRWRNIVTTDSVLGTPLAEPYVEFTATVVRYQKVSGEEILNVYGPNRNRKQKHQPVIQNHTKGKDDRSVPLNSLVFEALMNWKQQAREIYGYGTDDDDLVFPCVGPKKYLTFKNHTFREIAEQVGLPVHKRGTHCQRRSCGTFMLRLGVPLPTIQKILGHKDVLTTMKYLCDDVLPAGATSPLEQVFASFVQKTTPEARVAVTLPGSNVTHVSFGALSKERVRG